MSREKPESLQEARHWRTVEVLERVMADERVMAKMKAATEAIARGEKGVPFKQIQEEARHRQEAKEHA